MTSFGYSLATEEHAAMDIVRVAQQAEEAGFDFAVISDHFHPWVDAQGQSPFVWCVIGGIAATTSRIGLGTAVTCPTMRIHPAIIAQAAATAATMLPDRFFLGVGTGEALNEHILGDHWPTADVRLEMLEEAVDLMRTLWSGGNQSYYGNFYTVENARIYSLPDEPPLIVMAASGPKAGEAAGRISDGLMSTAPNAELVDAFHSGGDGQRPTYIQIKVCYDQNEAKARKLAHKLWPSTALPGQLGQELATPMLFEQASKLTTENQVAELVVCGPDPEQHAERIQQSIDAGFDHIAINQIGPEQEAAIAFYQREILPRFQ